MKDIEYARELARKHNDAEDVARQCKDKLEDLGLDYTAKKLLIENPTIEFVDIKDCKISYLTDKPVYSGYSVLSRQKIIPQPDGKVLVELED
jgi:hypothetical protein